MKKLPKICKGCVHAHALYGNRDKTGKRIASSYFCSEKNGKITNSGLKQCDKRRKAGEVSCLLKPSPCG